ncbi:BCCT family transporter [Bowmanella dokdonensis]|uniref:BCCT family transporter n=1 Tax=Bowmanella dokdonensis TaxID=751969 RepID=A0A939DQF3_9ALTE|nr:BCCT family transporter [Bowmanella dokdonensis]MBN7826482.1 BCCT family transporter [Bowmanella dokdonensis]
MALPAKRTQLPLIALLCCLVGTLILLLAPNLVLDWVGPAISRILSLLGRPFFLLLQCLLAGLLLLLLTPLARRRLGGTDARVEFSTPAWLSMLFAAGMGSGLVFWGVAEPVYHAANPPLIAPAADAAGQALSLTYLNWGLHAWALYAICGLLVSRLLSHGSEPQMADRVLDALGIQSAETSRRVARAVNLVALLAVFFGVTGTIANSGLLLRQGLEQELALDSPAWTGVLILFAIFVVYMSSAMTGLKRGIKRLSQFNMLLAALMLLIILWRADASALGSLILISTWQYLQLALGNMLALPDAFTEPKWLDYWTYNYHFWWLAWGPFVGMFLARISLGRPVWQYVLAVVLVPTLFSIVWFSAFGGLALLAEQNTPTDLLAVVSEDYTQGLMTYLGQLGQRGKWLIWLSLLLLLIFVATSADSAILVINQLTGSAGATQTLLWGLLLALAASGLFFYGQESLNRLVAIIGALPFLVIFVLQLLGALRAWLGLPGEHRL